MAKSTMRSRSALAIAAPHTAALDAAAAASAAGGNAIDIAVAAAAALTVAYPHMCGLGGDAILLVRLPDGRTRCVNSTGAYGSTPVPQLRDGGRMPIDGPLTVTVPGVVAAWDALHRFGGVLSTDQLLAPAIELAADGVPVSSGLAAALEDHQDLLRGDPGMREVFFSNGRLLREGDRLMQPRLAGTLQALAAHGLDDFYRGATASRFAAGLRSLGAPVARSDLARHEASAEEPLLGVIDGHRVFTAGPNSQGFSLLRTLGAIASADALADPDLGVVAELFHTSDMLRDSVLADPRFVPVDLEAILAAGAVAQAWEDATLPLTNGRRDVCMSTLRPTGDTVAVTVVDAQGTAISLIQSVFHAFGAKLLDRETGIIPHNRAAMFSLDPTSPNRLVAGKRPAHTLTPVVIEFADRTLAACGTMGGKAQTQVLTQIFLHAVSGLAAHEVVAAPRFVVGATEAGEVSDAILAEAGLAPAALEELARTGRRLTVTPGRHDDAGHAMIAVRGRDGALQAAGDPRSDGGDRMLGLVTCPSPGQRDSGRCVRPR